MQQSLVSIQLISPTRGNPSIRTPSPITCLAPNREGSLKKQHLISKRRSTNPSKLGPNKAARDRSKPRHPEKSPFGRSSLPPHTPAPNKTSPRSQNRHIGSGSASSTRPVLRESPLPAQTAALPDLIGLCIVLDRRQFL